MIKSFNMSGRILYFFSVVCFFALMHAAKSDGPQILVDLARIDALIIDIQNDLAPSSKSSNLHELRSEFLGLVLKNCQSYVCSVDDRILLRLLKLIANSQSSARWQALTALKKLGGAACPVLAELEVESKRQADEFYSLNSVATGIHFWYELGLTVKELEDGCK